MPRRFGLVPLVLLTACACEKPAPPPATTQAPAPTTIAASRPTDAWLGRWTGVEGTSLTLAAAGERYVVTVTDLDGPKTYEGTAAGDHIAFARGGRTETIRAATGQETGMKWLAGETRCLVITVGSEGYCRKAC